MADFVANYLQPVLDQIAAATGLDPTVIADLTSKANAATSRLFGSTLRYLEPAGLLANENGLLLIPPLRYYGLGTPTLYSPADIGGMKQGFWEVYVGAYDYATPQLVFLDTASGQVLVAPNAEDPYFADLGTAAKPVIAVLYANAIHTPFQIATNRPSEYAYANTGYAPITDANTRMAFTGDGVLNSYGIGRIYVATNGKPLVGGNIRRPGLNQQYFMRVWMLSDVDNDFPQVTAYAADANGLTYSRDVFKLEKQHSARVASFVNVTRSMIGSQQAVSLLAGVTGGTNRNIGISLQYAVAPDAGIWVSRQDNPLPSAEENTRLRVAEGSSAEKLIYPPRLALIEGRPMPLYVPAIIQNRNLEGSVCSVSFRSPEAMGAPPFVRRSRDTIVLDPGRIVTGAAGRITLQRPAPWADQRQWADVTAIVTAIASIGSKTVKVAFLGHSWIEGYPTWRYAREILKSCGVTVQLVGTMFRGTSDGGSADGNDQREGRSGIALIDYIYKRTGFASPVTDTSGYMGLGYLDKRTKNPFLFPSTAAGSYNGQRFDYGKYLAVAAYGLATPDIVVLEDGTNDPQFVTPQATPEAIVAQLKEAYGVIVPSIRATGAKVLMVVHQQGFGGNSNGTAEDYRNRGMIPAAISYAAGLADAGVQVCPSYAHTDSIAFGPYTTTGIDALTLAKTGTLVDSVHPGQWEAATQEHAECIAAHIAALMAA